jgi:hypothetical protein
MIQRYLNNVFVLLGAGLLAHLWLIQIGLHGVGTPMGDVPYAYEPWLNQMINSQKLLGINLDWVYPFPALLPIGLSALINPMEFTTGWMTLITIVNLVALYLLSRIRFDAAWYWLCFLVLLGPISISRIDSFSVAIAMFGVYQLVRRKLNPSTALFTVGASMKIWPIALLLPAIAASKHRVRILVSVAATAAVLLVFGLLLGGNQSMFSFLGYQSERGIQIESPIASWWIWSGEFGISNAGIYYDKLLMTFQVAGAGVTEVSALIGYAMYLALGITVWLSWRAAQAGATFQAILPAAALTATLDLIVFNKVGSPQFATWLAVPIVLGMLYQSQNWKVPTYSVIALGFVTYIIYPVIYDYILDAQSWAVGILLLRNLGYIALLIWANRELARLRTNSLEVA